ncbi:MAG: RING finger domain-containing protein [Candidatus Heimdallarchaeaceae archaeon]
MWKVEDANWEKIYLFNYKFLLLGMNKMLEIIEECSESIFKWIVESKKSMSLVNRTELWVDFRESFLLVGKQIAYFLNSLAPYIVQKSEEIHKIYFSPYQRFKKEFPSEIKIKISENKNRTLRYSKNKLQMALNLFPEFAKINEILSSFWRTFRDAPEEYILKTRKKINSVLDNSATILKEIEHLLQKNSFDIDEYISRIQQFSTNKLTIRILEEFNSKELLTALRNINRIRQQGKIYQLKVDLSGITIFEDEFLDLEKWFNKHIITQDMKAKKNELDVWVNKLIVDIDKIAEIEKKSANLIEQLEKMNPEFPVNLDRLAELINLSKEETEEAIKHTLYKFPDIGKYDDMAQMFVFSETKKKKKTKKPKKKIKCPDCGAELKSTLEKCPNCGKIFDICPICRGIITTEITQSCASCGRLFHKNHLEEWMNTNRNCPVCKGKL